MKDLLRHLLRHAGISLTDLRDGRNSISPLTLSANRLNLILEKEKDEH